MLREYEKAKLQMMNNDINHVNEDGTNDSVEGNLKAMNATGRSSKSPYNNFTRATTG